MDLKFQDFILAVHICHPVILLLKQNPLLSAGERHQPLFYLRLIRPVIHRIRNIQCVSICQHLFRIVKAVILFAL